MFTSRTLRTLTAGLLAGVALTVPTAQAQTTTLTLSSWVPSTHFMIPEILEPWIEDVKNATEGRVVINLLPTAVGAPAQHWELARRGVADITWGNFTYEPERFKHIWFAELPLMGDQGEANSVALWRTYEQFLAGNDVFRGVVLLGAATFGGGHFHHPSKAVDTLDALRGQKIRMGGPIQKRLLESLGAVPVAAPGPRAYELLEGGAIDASLHSIESVINFRVDSKLFHHTLVPESLYDATFFVAMNERKWQRLSEADREAIMKVSGERLSRNWGRAFDQQSVAAKQKMRNEGHVFAPVSDEVMAVIRSVRDEMLEELAQEGPTFGVPDYAAMVTFYQEQYEALKQ